MWNSQRLLFFKESGLGDDLMVFWAAVGAVLGKITAPGIRLYFEKPQTRFFLAHLAPFFPEIKLVSHIGELKNIAFVRHTSWLFKERPWGHFQSMVMEGNAFYEPYYHKWLTEYGSPYKPNPWVWLAIATGALKVWKPPYDETYDGWQQLSIALGFSNQQAKDVQSALLSVWPLIRERVGKDIEDNGEVLLFPGAGSSQSLGREFIGEVKDVISDVKVVRFYQDVQKADKRYATVNELTKIITHAKLVITTDSLSSHIAHFFARKHVLFCTRSRPDNVCFPGARNTTIIDLGHSLKCRPCLYTFHDKCAAGHQLCMAQKNLSDQYKESLAKTLGHGVKMTNYASSI